MIYSANGVQVLSIPVTKGSEIKMLTKDIRIDNSMHWQKIHFKSIESAYRNSPFYEYYIDELEGFFQSRQQFLYDFNLEILQTMCSLLKIKPTITGSADYINLPGNMADFRESIHPKPSRFQPDKEYTAPVYRQVFEPKLGFLPNLSILDLLFNTGPEAASHIKASIKVAE
jgi:hypothetical protein